MVLSRGSYGLGPLTMQGICSCSSREMALVDSHSRHISTITQLYGAPWEVELTIIRVPQILAQAHQRSLTTDSPLLSQGTGVVFYFQCSTTSDIPPRALISRQCVLVAFTFFAAPIRPSIYSHTPLPLSFGLGRNSLLPCPSCLFVLAGARPNETYHQPSSRPGLRLDEANAVGTVQREQAAV